MENTVGTTFRDLSTENDSRYHSHGPVLGNPVIEVIQHETSTISNESEGSSQLKRKGRKGHTKSRTGCLNCKKAKIKCKENKPACDYCAHRDLVCVWPELLVQQQEAQKSQTTNDGTQNLRAESSALSSYASTPSSTGSIAVTLPHRGPVFSMQDFRLFNMFIQKSYPHHPIGNDKVWRHEIPCLASDYDYLLHSMLALAGSELVTTTEPSIDMRNTALDHRVKAISSLNTAVANGIQTYEQGNAMIATCFSLLFQSCLLEGGLMEYMMFIRGTVSIGWSMGARRMKFIFDRIFDHEQLEQVDPMMLVAPLITPSVVATACRSFEQFRYLCVRKVEINVFGILSGIANSLVTSSRDGYLGLRKMYESFSYSMPQAEFEQYCDASSVVCQLLQAHFVALQLIMAPVTKSEQQFKEAEVGEMSTDYDRTVIWLVGIHSRVPDEWKRYFSWTKWVERKVMNGTIHNGSARDENEPTPMSELMSAWNDDRQFLTSG